MTLSEFSYRDYIYLTYFMLTYLTKVKEKSYPIKAY